MQRRLAAILAADVVGFSRLMEEDEKDTFHNLQSQKTEIIEPTVRKHQGRIVKLTGDGFLVEFSSVVEAVQCAVELQEKVFERNSGVDEARHIAYRMGINLGDVIVAEDDIYGDGVNIAARLETMAEAGGILISSTVHEHVERKLDLRFEDLGQQKFKNISEPVQVFAVGSKRDAEGPGGERPAVALPTIVVLPLDNLSNDPSQEYFCDGLTQDITTELCRFPNFFVIASKTAFVYKGARKSAEQIGSELHVRYILEGAVQKIANSIRVNTQLIDAQSGIHLWARRFDKNLTDLFDIQEQIIELIVGALAPKMAAVERARALRRPPEDVDAYDLFLRGAHHFTANIGMMSESESALAESCQWFKKAIEKDPSYARAWGWLAYAHATSWTEGWAGPEVLELAKEYAEKAVSLELEDYDTHWALAYVYSVRKEMKAALSAYATALSLNPNDPDMLVEMAETLVYVGQHEQARRQIEQAMRVNPRFPDWYRWTFGWTLHHLGEYEASNEQLEKIIAPNNEVRLIMAANHANLGATSAAALELQRFLQRRPDWTVEKERKTLSYLHAKDEEHWLTAIRNAGLPER
jgi:TolB-like protein/Tfp pilus assembly protein PilF